MRDSDKSYIMTTKPQSICKNVSQLIVKVLLGDDFVLYSRKIITGKCQFSLCVFFAIIQSHYTGFTTGRKITYLQDSDIHCTLAFKAMGL